MLPCTCQTPQTGHGRLLLLLFGRRFLACTPSCLPHSHLSWAVRARQFHTLPCHTRHRTPSHMPGRCGQGQTYMHYFSLSTVLIQPASREPQHAPGASVPLLPGSDTAYNTAPHPAHTHRPHTFHRAFSCLAPRIALRAHTPRTAHAPTRAHATLHTRHCLPRYATTAPTLLPAALPPPARYLPCPAARRPHLPTLGTGCTCATPR